jgi:hypothetical protein
MRSYTLQHIMPVGSADSGSVFHTTTNCHSIWVSLLEKLLCYYGEAAVLMMR